jgi:hypothetical protein
MADRFDKFTERARRVLTKAQEEAQRFNHNYMGTEHILLGLLDDREAVGVRVLHAMGVLPTEARVAVEFIIGRGEKSMSGEIGLTPRAKKVIELAVEEARRLNHTYIGTEHLLLGLIREGEGIAFGVLQSLGVTLDRTRTEVARVLSEPRPQSRSHEAHGPIAMPSGWEFGRGPLRLAPNAPAREQALHMVNQAAGALDGVRDSELSKELVSVFVVAQLADLLSLLDQDVDSIQELWDARGRANVAIDQLMVAERVLKKDYPTIAEAIAAAYAAVHRAIATWPAPGFLNPST